jgi:hypothetical protein
LDHRYHTKFAHSAIHSSVMSESPDNLLPFRPARSQKPGEGTTPPPDRRGGLAAKYTSKPLLPSRSPRPRPRITDAAGAGPTNRPAQQPKTFQYPRKSSPIRNEVYNWPCIAEILKLVSDPRTRLTLFRQELQILGRGLDDDGGVSMWRREGIRQLKAVISDMEINVAESDRAKVLKQQRASALLQSKQGADAPPVVQGRTVTSSPSGRPAASRQPGRQRSTALSSGAASSTARTSATSTSGVISSGADWGTAGNRRASRVEVNGDIERKPTPPGTGTARDYDKWKSKVERWTTDAKEAAEEKKTSEERLAKAIATEERLNAQRKAGEAQAVGSFGNMEFSTLTAYRTTGRAAAERLAAQQNLSAPRGSTETQAAGPSGDRKTSVVPKQPSHWRGPDANSDLQEGATDPFNSMPGFVMPESGSHWGPPGSRPVGDSFGGGAGPCGGIHGYDMPGSSSHWGATPSALLDGTSRAAMPGSNDYWGVSTCGSLGGIPVSAMPGSSSHRGAPAFGPLGDIPGSAMPGSNNYWGAPAREPYGGMSGSAIPGSSSHWGAPAPEPFIGMPGPGSNWGTPEPEPFSGMPGSVIPEPGSNWIAPASGRSSGVSRADMSGVSDHRSATATGAASGGPWTDPISLSVARHLSMTSSVGGHLGGAVIPAVESQPAWPYSNAVALSFSRQDRPLGSKIHAAGAPASITTHKSAQMKTDVAQGSGAKRKAPDPASDGIGRAEHRGAATGMDGGRSAAGPSNRTAGIIASRQDAPRKVTAANSGTNAETAGTRTEQEGSDGGLHWTDYIMFHQPEKT